MEQKLTQAEVDEVRRRVLTQILVSHVMTLRDPNPPVRHLRFHRRHRKDNSLFYEMRDGNPPANQDRHPWERDLRLELDLGYIRPEIALHVMRLASEMRASANKEPEWDLQGVKDAMAQLAHDSDMRIELPYVPTTLESLNDIALKEQIERKDVVNLIGRRAAKAARRSRTMH